MANGELARIEAKEQVICPKSVLLAQKLRQIVA